MNGFLRYFHTLIYLHPYQIIFRIYFRFFKLPVAKSEYKNPVLPKSGIEITIQTTNKAYKIFKGWSFEFLNCKRIFPADKIEWKNSSIPKLWLYQLHYFDYIHVLKQEEALEIIENWIEENQDSSEVGWEPYATSLRIINWIVFLTNQKISSPLIEKSLWAQYQSLLQKLEYHLMGNHLWENYRAIIIASIFFNQEKKRLRFEQKLISQFSEQILNDGAHAELSPMYQSIMVNGLILLRDFSERYGLRVDSAISKTIQKMSYYLAHVCHPDGKIAQFNDSALDFSLPSNEVLRLPVSSRLFSDSGHARIQNENLVVIADVGPVSHKYFAGHSHSDNLTFEVSFQGQRVIVDPGISTYEDSEQRKRERSTDFHNTLKVEGLEQSDTWKSFRLGRRAKTEESKFKSSLIGNYHFWDQGTFVSHSREWVLEGLNIRITDNIKCSSNQNARLSINFNPEIIIKQIDTKRVSLRFKDKILAKLESNVERIEIAESFYSPNFGKKIRCQRLLLHFKTDCQKEIITDIYFAYKNTREN